MLPVPQCILCTLDVKVELGSLVSVVPPPGRDDGGDVIGGLINGVLTDGTRWGHPSSASMIRTSKALPDFVRHWSFFPSRSWASPSAFGTVVLNWPFAP